MKTKLLHDIDQHGKKHHNDNTNIISFDDVSFSYTNMKKVKHLDSVSLKIKKGQWTTLIGPNGSGKSTVAKALVRINKVHSGHICMDNKNINSYKQKEFAKKVAYIPQALEIPSGTKVYDFISFGRNPYIGLFGTLSKKDKDIIKDAIDKAGVKEYTDSFMENLSGGQRQKVLMAMIYAQQAEIIVLDEPTTYLDIRNQYELLELMDQLHHEGKTIITILHDINQAIQYSDYIYVMKDGKIFKKGKPSEVINEDNLQAIYGIKVNLHTHGERKYITDIKLVG